MNSPILARHLVATALGFAAFAASAQLTGELPALGPPSQRLDQAQIASGQLSHQQLRHAGMRVFTARFNHYDGYGDGPMNHADPTSPGGRPTLGRNGTFLRINGLDAQSCNDCHGFVSSTAIPPVLGIGGAGGLNNAVLFMPHWIDVNDSGFNGFASFDGRLIVPPALFGSGGIQLLAEEMTQQLHAQRDRALANPGERVDLIATGVRFGHVVADAAGHLDVSTVDGVSPDLVIRPFGRKGEFATVRAFDQEAMRFHFGIEPTEVVGVGVDADGDGVVDEINSGEMSALEIFLTTQDRPRQLRRDETAEAGFELFEAIGCADCHRPLMRTRGHRLSYRLPGAGAAYHSVDLRDAPARFERSGRQGIMVRLFGDLKRHDMGYELSEDFQGAPERINHEFITAELWGVADTAPYLHDGRALTLNAAIVAHGGEAQAARDAYVSLGEAARDQVLRFLHTLRNPAAPNADVIASGGDGKASRTP